MVLTSGAWKWVQWLDGGSLNINYRWETGYM